jgi:hypothetical protein
MEALGKDQDEDFVRADLDFTARLGGANPKSYQIFYHRQALLENVSMEHFGKLELDYTAEVLTADSKNYHAWTLRQWVVTKMNTEQTWAEELDFGECYFSFMGITICDQSCNNLSVVIRHFGTCV